MKSLTKLTTLFLFILITASSPIEEKDVYICTGKYSKKYHYDKDCKGLNNCKAIIKKLTESKAKETRTLCGFED